MDRVFQDLRYGWRLLRKNPGFAAVAALTLALGIGANTAMFSVINVVLLRPLPFKDPDHLMFVYQTMANGNPNVFSTPAYLEWKQQQGPLADMAALSPVQLNLSGGALPERVTGARVSQNLFPVVGAEPLLGRNFAVDEDRPGSGRTIILSHALWKTRFDSRADLLGSPDLRRALRLGGPTRFLRTQSMNCVCPTQTSDFLSARRRRRRATHSR